MSNQLAEETSLYLLQHKDNPVNWYPWGKEAFTRARDEDKPIFLSIGYSACHWCHVMERESFEDEETAALLNRDFIAIKVDREERPDVDSIYMRAVQAITGGGGWPMSVWLLPDGRPFFGGTYYPEEPRYGMPSFRQILQRVIEVYQHNRPSLEKDAGNLIRVIDQRMALDAGHSRNISVQSLESLFQPLADQYDEVYGGFGAKPKFPPAMTLELLLRLNHRSGWKHALEMATTTLTRMAHGGLYDQIGGGFHRYSIDAQWLVPHFEKMLYDNALLIRVYGQAFQVTKDALYKQIVEQTIEYVRREMTSPDGGFFSAQDADSEGQEGRFFVWERAEFLDCLQDVEHYQAVIDYWGASAGPNFEGRSILWVPEDVDTVASRHKITSNALLLAIESARLKLFSRREMRIKPARDEKILTAWNGLMIHSLAQAGRILGRPDYIDMAKNAARFVLNDLQRDDKLLRTYAGGQARIEGFLEDYAFFIEGLIELYQSTFDPQWFNESVRLANLMQNLFWQEGVGFCDTSSDHEMLIARPQELTDNAIPAGSSSAVAVLLRLAILTGNSEWQSRAQAVLEHLASTIVEYPGAFSYLACQMDFFLSEPHEIALIGKSSSPEMQKLLAVIAGNYRPNHIVALSLPGDKMQIESPLLQNRPMIDGKATAYVCRNYICQLPVNSPEELEAALSRN